VYRTPSLIIQLVAVHVRIIAEFFSDTPGWDCVGAVGAVVAEKGLVEC
jgi:hypothetical protein